jgi:hypothetical protein
MISVPVACDFDDPLSAFVGRRWCRDGNVDNNRRNVFWLACSTGRIQPRPSGDGMPHRCVSHADRLARVRRDQPSHIPSSATRTLPAMAASFGVELIRRNRPRSAA